MQNLFNSYVVDDQNHNQLQSKFIMENYDPEVLDNLKTVFDEAFKQLKFDRTLVHKFKTMQVNFISKNEEHMAFFGGKLLGVNRVKFTADDFNMVYDTCKLDVDKLQRNFEKVPAIVSDREVAGDLFNFTLVYITHRFFTSPLLNEKERITGAMATMLLFNYRTVSALITRSFKFLASKELALRAYERLSGRFLIKQLNNWQEVMEYRANSVIEKTSIHYQIVKDFLPDLSVVNIVVDAYGRINSMIKNMYGELVLAKDDDDKMSKDSLLMIDLDGKETVKEKTTGFDFYVDYIFEILPDDKSLIKKEVLSISLKAVNTCQQEQLTKSLNWISEHYFSKDKKEIEEFIRLSILHAFNFLESIDVLRDKSFLLDRMLVKLRGMFMSSRSTDEDLLKIRDLGFGIVHSATGKTNDQVVSSIRTALILYLFVRAYTKNFYQH